MKERTTQWLLIAVAVLLLANLLVTSADWLVNPRKAEANIVEGKTWFSTSSPDGQTVYLWQYWSSSEVGPNAKAKVFYYGRVAAGGDFVEGR